MSYIVYKLSNGQLLADWCRDNKIPYGTVFNYIDKGMTVEEACEAGKKAREKALTFKPAMYKGKPLREQFPTAYSNIMTHIRKKHCMVEEAVEMYKYNITHPFKPRNIKPVINVETGECYKSIVECAKMLKVSPTTIRKLIKKGTNLKYKEK